MHCTFTMYCKKTKKIRYNYDKMFPCYGFGAKLPDGKV